MSGEKITIGFSGDLSFSGYFTGSHTDNGLIDDGIKAFFGANDYNVINYESPVTPCRITKKKRLAHRSAPEALDFVKKNIPNPVLSFANNHMMDYGPIGVVDTIDSCKQRDIKYLGIGLNLKEAGRYVMLGDEIKVGVLAIQYKKYLIASENAGGPLHESSTNIIKHKLEKLKKNADYVVVVYHGGDEFLHTPMPYTRRQLKRYLEWGADVVVAHHPHTVQGFEPVGKNKMIFYSLGNFMFDTDYQRVQQDTDNGMLLRLSFDKNGFNYETLPVHIDRENKKVTVGDEMRWFKDIRKGYDKAWSSEAYRLDDIKERAAQLKEKELSELAERTESERIRLEAIQAQADIREAMMEASDSELFEEEITEAQAEAEAGIAGQPAAENAENAATAKRSSLNSIARRYYKRVIVKRSDNYKSAVRKLGRLKKKTIYR